MPMVNQEEAVRDALEELATENARLRQLVGELLLKNQRLREGSLADRAALELSQGSA